MKRLFTLFLGLFVISHIQAQTVDCSRTAVLINGAYNMEGRAYLERFNNGNVQLRLGDDFATDAGPDVQIFLSNDSTSTAGGIMLADIGTNDGENHFDGAITFPIADNITMAQYDFVVFRCVTFDAYWGGGRLAEPTCNNPGDSGGGVDTMVTSLCMESTVATTNWASEVTVCPVDGIDDIIPLMNNNFVEPGDQYAYVFADANNNIKFLHYEDSYNFEGSSLEPDYIFGLSYRGTLSYNIGQPITSITSDSCAMISSLTTFLTVNKENCLSNFQCMESITATTNWGTSVEICPGDGTDDIVPFLNNQFAEPGDHYSYLITDTQNRLVAVHNESSYNFEGSGGSPNRVFGINFAGTLNYNIGDHISSISADSCFQLSDTTLYLTILKTGCIVIRIISRLVDVLQVEVVQRSRELK